MRLRTRRAAVAAFLLVAVTVAILLAMGRNPICTCGTVELWVGVRDSPKTSQMLADWYSLSHIVHGLLFYAALWLVARRWPVERRFLIALVIEASWEIAENTPWVIDRYRTATAAFGYTGDSLINSLSDIMMMAVGFLAARRLPLWGSIALLSGARARPALRDPRQSDAQRVDAAVAEQGARRMAGRAVKAPKQSPRIVPPMKLALSLLALALLAAPASAGELFGGVYAHDVDTPLTASGIERGADIQLGWRGGRIGRTPLQPYVFGALNTAGETSYVAAGLSAKLGRQVYLRPGLGIAIHNGSAKDFNDPTNGKIDFGSRILFEPELGIGAQLNDRLSVEASWVHMSHAQLFGRQNPGIDNVGVRVNLAF